MKASIDSNHQNNKRIAKNTLLLYFRLLITMGIGLYSSRIVLNALGVEDFGVYNVVGGVVAMFSLFTNSLSASTSRFLAFELGEQDENKLASVFSTSVSIQLIMASIIMIAAEVAGIFFLDWLNIPEERMDAARWVYHFAVLTFAINLISVPYNAAIIAHEKMNAFAIISILDAALKLLIAFMLYFASYDKLITYAASFAAVAVMIRLFYGIYCRTHFQECRYNFSFDKRMLKDMSGFAGWNFWGSGAYLLNTQGVNIVTNLFFGVATNAARGVTNQLEGAVKHFVTSFTTAINPQIIKSYAAGNLDYMHSLVCRGAKFSYLLMLFFVIPLMFEAETVLSLWLKNYPPEAPLFLKISLVGTMFDMLGNSTANAAWATGNIKRYYIIVSCVGCLVFPISWICFALGCDAYFSYIIFALIYFVLIFVKIFVIRDLISFSPQKFFQDVLLKILPVTIFSFAIPLVIYLQFDQSILRLFIISCTSVLSVTCSSFFLGLSENERNTILSTIKSKLARLKK